MQTYVSGVGCFQSDFIVDEFNNHNGFPHDLVGILIYTKTHAPYIGFRGSNGRRIFF